jgi:hypothetical protein
MKKGKRKKENVKEKWRKNKRQRGSLSYKGKINAKGAK